MRISPNYSTLQCSSGEHVANTFLCELTQHIPNTVFPQMTQTTICIDMPVFSMDCYALCIMFVHAACTVQGDPQHEHSMAITLRKQQKYSHSCLSITFMKRDHNNFLAVQRGAGKPSRRSAPSRRPMSSPV